MTAASVTVSQTQPAARAGELVDPGSPGAGRCSPRIWLFFLLDPLLEGWAHRDELRRRRSAWSRRSRSRRSTCRSGCGSAPDRQRLIDTPAAALVAGLPRARWSLLGVLMAIACVGEPGTACAVYIARRRASWSSRAGVAVAGRWSALVVGIVALGAPSRTGAARSGSAFAIMAASRRGLRHARRDAPQHRPRPRPARRTPALAVDNERTRFARDLHDILGHSLTVITVKAELAQRLLDVDLDRARAEIADLERLSRDALADVRRAVEGYREHHPPRRAGPGPGRAGRRRDRGRPARTPTDDVPSELRELFAWTVREGVTNVIRHCGAPHCEVRLTADQRRGRRRRRAARTATAPGSGLAGLRERADAVGATVSPGSSHPRLLAAVVRGMSEPIRLLLADDQALVRGALAALLEPRARPRGGRRGRLAATRSSPPSSSTTPTSPCSTSRCPGSTASPRPPRSRARLPDTKVLIVTTFGRPGLPAPRDAGRRGRLRRQGHPGRPARRRRTPGARRAARRRPALATDSLVRRRVAADPAGDRRAARGPRTASPVAAIAARAVPLRGHRPQPPLRARSARPAPPTAPRRSSSPTGNGWL